jgi:hypothetical protein
VTINDDGGSCGRGSSALTFTAQPGVDYWIIVSAYSKLIVSVFIVTPDMIAGALLS